MSPIGRPIKIVDGGKHVACALQLGTVEQRSMRCSKPVALFLQLGAGGAGRHGRLWIARSVRGLPLSSGSSRGVPRVARGHGHARRFCTKSAETCRRHGVSRRGRSRRRQRAANRADVLGRHAAGLPAAVAQSLGYVRLVGRAQRCGRWPAERPPTHRPIQPAQSPRSRDPPQAVVRPNPTA